MGLSPSSVMTLSGFGDATVPPAAAREPVLGTHDRQQLELQLTHRLPISSDHSLFDVEVFLFIPRNVGASADNYRRDEFYGDLTTFVRLDLPHMSLEELAADQNGHDRQASPAREHSPLYALRRQLEAICRGEPAGRPAVDVKLFGHLFTEAVRDRLRSLLETLGRLSGEPETRRWLYLDEVERFAQTACRALEALRRARRYFEPLAHAAPVLETFRFTDEYSSLFLDGAMALLARSAHERPELFDGSGFVGRLDQVLARYAQREAVYRAANGYPNLVPEQAEYFVYRQSFLKKAVQQALYVDTGRLSDDKFVRNATGAVAAGLAATWALVAQVPARIESLSPTVQTVLFALPVLAYVAKDRIKELTRDWLTHRIQGFDKTNTIHAGSLAEAGLGELSGRVRERMHFTLPTEVPPDVLAARVARRTVRNAEIAGETVLVYHRRLELNPRQAPSQHGVALRQIMRLNLRHFLTRLDEPKQEECHYIAGDRQFARIGLPKVYHLNLMARVDGHLKRWRVVLNKEGIVRMETVAVAPTGPVAPMVR